MVGTVSLLKWALLPGEPLWLRLVLEIAAGASAYLLTLLLLHRERMATFVRTARAFRRVQA